MTHPHKDVIANMNEIGSLVGIIEDSKINYIRGNLSIHLHESQIKLLKRVFKHEKPHHKKVRARQYAKLGEETSHFKIHKKLYLKNYSKLAKKGLVEIINEDFEYELPYDVILTDKGRTILDEIYKLEKDWQDIIGCDENTLEVLQSLALNSFEISYKFKKSQNFIF
ncbi:hypothetical protein [Methanobrevibacter oralis]|nr:hypothetical protein [Methanobrevibacter oralis]